jgi:hypothetical protein
VRNRSVFRTHPDRLVAGQFWASDPAPSLALSGVETVKQTATTSSNLGNRAESGIATAMRRAAEAKPAFERIETG